MSNIFVTEIVGTGTYAIPANDTQLSNATTGLDALLSGVANLSYDRVLAWVQDQGGPDGAEGVRSLNCIVEAFTYSGEVCPDETETDTLIAAIESALEADANITTIGKQQVSIFDPGQTYLWTRSPSGFLYPTADNDEVTVGPDSASTGVWFDDGDMVLGASVMSDTEKMRVVGNARIQGEWLFTEQAATPIDPAATEGVFWVKNDTPSRPYFTDGADVEHELATGAGPESLPNIQQVIFVDKTSLGYVADGSMDAPYNSIASAIAAATALTPTATNRILIVIYPGVYNEALTQVDSYVYFAGYEQDSTIVRQSSGASPPLTITDDETGFFNLTFEVDTTHTGSVAACSTNLAGPVRFVRCSFLGNGATSTNNYVSLSGACGGDFEFVGCFFFQSDLSELVFYNSSNTNGTQTRFFDCTFQGRFREANGQSASTTEAYGCDFYANDTVATNGVVRVEPSRTLGYRFMDCRFENAGSTGPAVYGLAGMTDAKFTGCRFVGGSSAVDINADGGRELVAQACMFTEGLGTGLVPADGFLYTGPGIDDVPFHQSLDDAITAFNASSLTKGWVVLRQDETLTGALSTPPSGTEVIIDGQGIFAVTRTGNTVISTAASRLVRFRKVYIDGEVEVTGAAAEVFFERCRLDGRFRLTSVDANTRIRAHDSAFVGDATYTSPVVIGDSLGQILFSGCYIKGNTGNGGVLYETTAGTTYDFDGLYMKETICMHGSLGSNNPFEGTGQGGSPPTNLYYAMSCGFNEEPDVADPTYLANQIDTGQRQNTIDPDADWTWQPAW